MTHILSADPAWSKGFQFPSDGTGVYGVLEDGTWAPMSKEKVPRFPLTLSARQYVWKAESRPYFHYTSVTTLTG